MKRIKRHPALAALFVLALLAGGVGVAQAQQTDPAPQDSTACPMMGEDGKMDMEDMDMQAMMERCPMMQRMMEDGEGMNGMMGMMSMMKDCPMMRQMMERCPMMGGMMEGMMRSDSTMQHNGMMPGMMQNGTGSAPTPAGVEDGVQTAAVAVGPGGFEPDAIRLKAGVPTRLVFMRTTDRTCATEVRVPAFGVERTALPLNEEVAVEFTPGEAGTFAFTCGMDMKRGTIIVTN